MTDRKGLKPHEVRTIIGFPRASGKRNADTLQVVISDTNVAHAGRVRVL